MMFPKQKDVDTFYGNPRGLNGKINLVWKRANIVTIIPPWLIYGDNGKLLKGIECHRKVAPTLTLIFDEIWSLFQKKQAAIHAIGLDKFNGSLVYREKRSGNGLSMHAYGIAFDFNAGENVYGSHKMSMNSKVVAIFEKYGAVWGGRWSHPDGMHFQFAHVA
jgi:hypothetical protein